MIDRRLQQVMSQLKDGVRIPVIVELRAAPSPALVRELKGAGLSVTTTSKISPLVYGTATSSIIRAISASPIVVRVFYDEPLYPALALPFGLEVERQEVVPIGESVAATRAPALWEQGITGAGVKIGVIDTGTSQSHEMISPGLKGTFSAVPGESVEDENHHGSWCCSAAAGRPVATENGELVGAAPGADLYALKALSDAGTGKMSWVMQCVEKAAVDFNCDVISMSLGSMFDNGGLDPISKLVNDVVRKHNVLCAVAAGNCLTPDTKILTVIGGSVGKYKQITELREGDHVFAYNPDTGKLEKDRILKTMKRQMRKGEKLFKIVVKGTKRNYVLTATEEHPILVVSNGNLEWVEVSDLKIGDDVFTYGDINAFKNKKHSSESCKKMGVKKDADNYCEWKQNVAEKTKAAIWEPDVRERYLEGLKNRRVVITRPMLGRTGKSHPNWSRVEITCPLCGDKFEVKRSFVNKRKYCSHKCAAVANDFGSKAPDNIGETGTYAIRKYREENPDWFEVTVSDEFKQHIGDASSFPYDRESAVKGAIAARKKIRDRNFRTSIEILLEKAIYNRGFRNYEIEYPVFDTYGDLICFPDIAFPDDKIAIFADGDYWHNLPKSIENDTRVNKRLTENGWVVYRFWEHDIKKDPDECVLNMPFPVDINGVVDPEILSIEEIPQVEYVYDIMTEKLHNFIADGIVVHNSFIPLSIGSPGGAIAAVTVGSYALRLPMPGTPSSFESKGPTTSLVIKPDTSAPGGNILAPGIAEMILAAGAHGSYQSMAGTSMATPQAAGVLALLRQAKPDLSRTEVEQLLAMSAFPVPKDTLRGYGPIRADTMYGNLGRALPPITELQAPLNALQSAIYAPLTLIPRPENERLRMVRLPAIMGG